MIPYDRPDAVGAWWERRIPRLAISPFVGRERQARYRIGRLAVDVLAAARLAAADWEGTSDPYVVVSLSGPPAARTTRIAFEMRGRGEDRGDGPRRRRGRRGYSAETRRGRGS